MHVGHAAGTTGLGDGVNERTRRAHQSAAGQARSTAGTTGATGATRTAEAPSAPNSASARLSAVRTRSAAAFVGGWDIRTAIAGSADVTAAGTAGGAGRARRASGAEVRALAQERLGRAGYRSQAGADRNGKVGPALPLGSHGLAPGSSRKAGADFRDGGPNLFFRHVTLQPTT